MNRVRQRESYFFFGKRDSRDTKSAPSIEGCAGFLVLFKLHLTVSPPSGHEVLSQSAVCVKHSSPLPHPLLCHQMHRGKHLKTISTLCWIMPNSLKLGCMQKVPNVITEATSSNLSSSVLNSESQFVPLIGKL